MTTLPRMPRVRKIKPLVPCACGGCGQVTKSVWFSGHDGHCTGWAVRIEKGILTIDDVPEAVRAGVAKVLAARGTKVELPKTRKELRAERREADRLAKLAAAEVVNVTEAA